MNTIFILIKNLNFVIKTRKLNFILLNKSFWII
jgi:hypothetical protein